MTRTWLSVALVLLAPAAAAKPRLLGFWDFEPCSTNIIRDRSGLRRDGVIVGSPLHVRGIKGTALRFSAVGDFVDFGDPIIPPGDFSITVWVNCDDVEKQFFLGQYIHRHPQRLDLAVREGSVRIQIDAILDSPKLVHPRRWHHIAYTRSSGQVTIYLDGERVASALLPVPVLQTTAMIIGRIDVPNQDSFRFTGIIDELKVWDGPLTAAEVRDEFRQVESKVTR